MKTAVVLGTVLIGAQIRENWLPTILACDPCFGDDDAPPSQHHATIPAVLDVLMFVPGATRRDQDWVGEGVERLGHLGPDAMK
jgi:hypothetical protein